MTNQNHRYSSGVRRGLAAIAIAAVAGLFAAQPLHAADPVRLGIVAALSGPSAQSGEAITRGLTVAMDEINAAGGILGGRMIELIRRDDESSPPKGVIAARELIFKEEVAAFFGGIDSPVSLAIVPLANKSKVPFMGVWAAATPITRNGADPNYVFRVSAVDAIVDIKLLQYAHSTFGATKVGLMLINNPWGRIERARSPRGGRGQRRRRDRRGREVREQRRRHDPAAHPPQGQGSGRPRARH